MFTFNKPGDISALMQWQEAAGFGFRNEVYRAALAGELAVVEVLPGVTVPPDLLRRSHPVVIIVGDDGGISDGPQDFAQARKLLRWSRLAMIHAAGGEIRPYQWIADAARAYRNVLLVETTSAAEPAWMALMERERGIRTRKKRPPLSGLVIRVPADMPPHPTVGAAA